MDELKKKATELLESLTVKVVIGYEEGTAGRTRALFAEKPEDACRLIYDSRCVQNLATYLTKREVRDKGRIAIEATLPVMRSIIQLAAEFQVSDANLLVLGITPDGKLIEFGNLAEVEAFIHQYPIEINQQDREELAKIEKK